jgi:hypothetical protein
VSTNSVATPQKKSVVYGGYQGSFPGVERVGPELGHSPSSSAKVKNERVYHLTPVRLRGTDRDSLTCYLYLTKTLSLHYKDPPVNIV